jgi:hypothetical protein
MCPEQQIISIYVDGELPSPWKEKLENHMKECSSCKEKLDSFKQIQGLFKLDNQTNDNVAASEDAFIQEAKERVWKKLESQSSRYFRSSRIFEQRNQHNRNYSVWKRRLSITIPAAAAAAIVIALVTILFVRGNPGSINSNNGFANIPIEIYDDRPTNLILAAEEHIPDVIPTSDISSILQYLGIDNPEIIIINLPETRNFSRYGEPAIIRAADHLGR